nr:hypothetical protein [Tanacetum cinerariifolium]
MESPNWTEINAGIQQHLQKAYNTNKAAFKAQHWVIDPTTGTYNVEKIRRERPEYITASEWDKYADLNHSGVPEMRRLEAMGTYIDDEINRLARGDMFSQFESGGSSGSGGCGDQEEGADHQDDEDEDGDGDA